MAYEVDIRAPRCDWQSDCRWAASVTLYSTKNEKVGNYCRPHLKQAMARQLELEGEPHYCANCGRQVDRHV